MQEFDIENIFDNIPADEIPCNRPAAKIPEEIHTIVAGGTCSNLFTVLFPYIKDLKIQVIYRQLNKLVVIKEPAFIDVKKDHFVIEVTFTPEESDMFRNTLLDTKAQVLVMFDGKKIYTDIFDIKVIDALLEERVYDGTNR